jgi:hypothetical protein
LRWLRSGHAEGRLWDWKRPDMANLTNAWELEQQARAINATDWQPLPGM